jgi:hypothetical protein
MEEALGPVFKKRRRKISIQGGAIRAISDLSCYEKQERGVPSMNNIVVRGVWVCNHFPVEKGKRPWFRNRNKRIWRDRSLGEWSNQ